MKTFLLLTGVVALLSLAAQAARLPMVPINGKHMVALTTFADAFGATARYDGNTTVITLALGSRTVQMVPYWDWAWVDGQPVQVDTPVVIVDSVVYLPLRFVTAVFELPVSWIDTFRVASIADPAGQVSREFVLDERFPGQIHRWQLIPTTHGSQLIVRRDEPQRTSVSTAQIVSTPAAGLTLQSDFTLPDVPSVLGTGFEFNPLQRPSIGSPQRIDQQLTPYVLWTRAIASNTGRARSVLTDANQQINQRVNSAARLRVVLPTSPRLSPLRSPLRTNR